MSKAQTLPVAFLKTAQVFVVIFALLLLFAVMPAPARAATTLTPTQIQAVVGLLASFNVDTETIGAVQAQLDGTYTGVPQGDGEGITGSSSRPAKTDTKDTHPPLATAIGSSTPGACLAFARTLVKGSNGPDVASLQGLLMRTGDLKEASSTGYFGSITEAALKAWQAKQGIVTGGDSSTTGFGSAGPQTRAALLSNCMQLEKDRMGSGDGRFGSSTASTTRRMPPLLPHLNTGGPSSMLAPLQQVSSLLVSGTAAVIDGYLSLFNLNL